MLDEKLQNDLYREGMSLASIKKRALAFLIDELLLSLILMIAISDKLTPQMSTQETIMVVNSFVFEYMIIKIIYQTFFVHYYGATVGKLLMKIKVVEIGLYSNPQIASAINRAVFRIISEMIMWLGFLWGVLNPTRQTWHDKTARTLVVDA